MNNHSRIFAAWRNSKCFLNARFAARTFRSYLEMAVPLLHFYFLSRAIQFRFISAISVKWNVPLWRAIKMTSASPFLFLHHCVGAPESVCVYVRVCVCVWLWQKQLHNTRGKCIVEPCWLTSYSHHFVWNAKFNIFPSTFFNSLEEKFNFEDKCMAFYHIFYHGSTFLISTSPIYYQSGEF